MRKILVLGFLFILIGCKSKKLTPDSPRRYIIGNLADVATEKKLAKFYPEAEITHGTDMFREGTEERPFTLLYPDTPNEVLIIWNNNAKTQLYGIMISENGKWKSKTGIKIGTTYNELVALNKGPISFYGFGWDYGGAVDWNGGKLENSKVHVFLAPKGKVPNSYYGDKIIKATPEEIEALQLSVQSILYKEED